MFPCAVQGNYCRFPPVIFYLKHFEEEEPLICEQVRMVVKLLVDPLMTRGYQCANSSHSFSVHCEADGLRI